MAKRLKKKKKLPWKMHVHEKGLIEKYSLFSELVLALFSLASPVKL